MSGPHPAAQDTPRGPAAIMFAADQASRSVGMELVHAGPGTAVVRMRIAMQMLNGHAIAHGGKVAGKLSKDKIVVINLSGRGDKDCQEVARLIEAPKT